MVGWPVSLGTPCGGLPNEPEPARPAFQEFAASMLANIHFRMLSPAERGLLYTMRLECWVNHGLPRQPAQLAKVLGFALSEVENALPSVMPFFSEESGHLICPELENYRAHLASIRTKQSEGGKQSAANKKGKQKSNESIAAQGTPGNQSHLSDTCKSLASNLQVLSSVQSNPVQPNKTQSSGKGEYPGVDSWVSDYDRVSNGGCHE